MHTLTLTDDELDFLARSIDAMVRINGLAAAPMAVSLIAKLKEQSNG